METEVRLIPIPEVSSCKMQFLSVMLLLLIAVIAALAEVSVMVFPLQSSVRSFAPKVMHDSFEVILWFSTELLLSSTGQPGTLV